MSNKTTTVTQGLGFLDILAVVFIVLKLVGVIHWSWWWVLAPIWMPLGLVLAFLVVILIAAIIAG